MVCYDYKNILPNLSNFYKKFTSLDDFKLIVILFFMP